VLLWGIQPLVGSASLSVARAVLLAACVALTALTVRSLRSAPRKLSAAADYAALLVLIAMLSLSMAFYAHYLIPVVGLAALGADARLRAVVLALCVGALVNDVLGVDSLIGGPRGPLLDVICSLILLAALSAGLVRAGWSGGRRLARSTA
jgi:hypothetical protein